MNYIKYFCLISTQSIWAMGFLTKHNQIKISLKTNYNHFQGPLKFEFDVLYKQN